MNPSPLFTPVMDKLVGRLGSLSLIRQTSLSERKTLNSNLSFYHFLFMVEGLGKYNRVGFFFDHISDFSFSDVYNIVIY